ncbi:MAG: hypothetical protein K2X81_03525, partial [Candidatus Obscuribacterales bacterium]|nr:hypothetical protein [Candidatus Obscuribacterales bacterium]
AVDGQAERPAGGEPGDEQNREAERRIFRFVEPLFSLLSMRKLSAYPYGELNHATRLLLKNHPHDSICGCSIDAVHDEMMTRFSRIHQVLNPLLEDAATKLSSFPDGTPLVPEDPSASLRRLRALNPHGRSFSGVVPKQWYVPVGEADAHAADSAQICESETVDQLFGGFGRVPYYAMVDRKKGWIWVEDLVPFGEDNLAWPLEAKESKHPLAKMRGKAMENGMLTVHVDDDAHIEVTWRANDGTNRQFNLSHLICDTGDGGDTYNYDPLPGDKPIYAKLISVHPKLKGPLVCSLLLKYEIQIPEGIVEEKSAAVGKDGAKVQTFRRSTNKIKHEITTEIFLKRGSRILEFETSWNNQSSAHRLELRISTGSPVHATFSENHFSLLRRYHQTHNIQKMKLPVEVGFEAPCDRYPTQRFVVANGQLFLNRGLPEYGAEGDTVTMTLLRAVPILSRGRMQTRGGGAGPHLATPGADCKGENRVSYAWAPLEVLAKRRLLSDVLEDSSVCEAFDLAEAYEQEIFTALTSRHDTATHSLLSCDNPAVRILGAYMSKDTSSVFVRLQNICTEMLGTRVLVDFDFQSAHLCRLDEETGEEVFLYREYIKIKSEDGNDTDREICALDINFHANEVKTIEFRLQQIPAEKPASASRTRKKRSASTKIG